MPDLLGAGNSIWVTSSPEAHRRGQWEAWRGGVPARLVPARHCQERRGRRTAIMYSFHECLNSGPPYSWVPIREGRANSHHDRSPRGTDCGLLRGAERCPGLEVPRTPPSPRLSPRSGGERGSVLHNTTARGTREREGGRRGRARRSQRLGQLQLSTLDYEFSLSCLQGLRKKTSSPTSPHQHRPDVAQNISPSSLPFGEKKKREGGRSGREEEREKVSSRSHVGKEAGLAMPLNILLLGSSPSVSRAHPSRAEVNYSCGQH